MAFDGVTVAALCSEFSNALTGGRIARITQPEKDALLITVKNNSKTCRLILSANPSMPLARLTDRNLPAPVTAPAFCMLLRKHLAGGRILSVRQPSMERVLRFEVEHRNEMGDPCHRFLVAELMGKYSNLILTDEDNQILDAIRRIPSSVSSVREVLPGRRYFLPDTMHKLNPLTVTETEFAEAVCRKPCSAAKALYMNLTGISPEIAEEICFRSGVDGGLAVSALDETARTHLFHTMQSVLSPVREENFCPCVYYDRNAPVGFSAFELSQYRDLRVIHPDSVSSMIQLYFEEKEIHSRIRQKSTDLRKLTGIFLDRTSKKLNRQEQQLKSTEKKDTYRIYGELINTYGYSMQPGSDRLHAVNYYDGKQVDIPMNPNMSVSWNAQHYFDRYTKLKRTEADLTIRIQDTKKELEHLRSIRTALDLSEDEADLRQIRDELADAGYLRKRSVRKGIREQKSRPLHFRSSDGYDIYVGKNNYQNEYVSFKLGDGNDWWFHAKKMPGSHVIVKSGNGAAELPDRTFEEAAGLAAYFSEGRNAPKVEVDYTLRKHLKRPPGANPGFVIYHTNYSMMSAPDCSNVQRVPDGGSISGS